MSDHPAFSTPLSLIPATPSSASALSTAAPPIHFRAPRPRRALRPMAQSAAPPPNDASASPAPAAAASTTSSPAAAASSAAGAALVPIKRALISVSDKTSLQGLASVLVEQGVEIISTGGTYSKLSDIGIPVRQVSQLTGYPELLDGRVKTLHPLIHAGLLSIRDNESHQSTMDEYNIAQIDLLIVNLYPFEQTAAQNKPFDQCVENIDVGGPTMIRAAAKNFKFVTVVTDPSQYGQLISELEENSGKTSLRLRKKLAAHAFARLSAYDSCIAEKFSKELGESFPSRILISATLKQRLRYGENPHQQAAFYTLNNTQVAGVTKPCLASAEQVQGKELSYNNIADTDAAFELVSEFNAQIDGPVCCIVKHANPCGVACGVTPQDAYLRALACDPISAFGGIVALNVTVDKHVAEEISKLFTEVIIAPDATAEALDILSKKKNLRVLLTGSVPQYIDEEEDEVSIINESNIVGEIDDQVMLNGQQDLTTPSITIDDKTVAMASDSPGSSATSNNNNNNTNSKSNSSSNSNATAPSDAHAVKTFKSVSGGMLMQTHDNGKRSVDDVEVVSKRKPSDKEMKDLLFAWKVCKHVKSNAIVYVKDLVTVGTGAGQMSRVDASRIAAWKAEEASSNAAEDVSRTKGSVVASDAFFPFADGLVAAAQAGATAVIQPGGSKRDAEVIAAADERGLAMVMTGMRHFKH